MNSRSPKPQAYSAAGFTLAELLVATTLIAVVMTTVYATFHTSMRTWREADAGYRPFRDARRAIDFIERDLRGIPHHAMHLFEGTENRIEFYTFGTPLNPDEATAPRMLRVRYRLSGGAIGEGRRLIREEAVVTSALPGRRVNGEAVRLDLITVGREHSLTVASEIVGMEFAYFWTPPFRAVDSPEEIELMVENFAHAGLPQAIEIRLQPDTSVPETLEFSSRVVFRKDTSPLPEALIERWQRERGAA